MKDAASFHWALVSKEPVPNTGGKNYLEQTEILSQYIKNRVFHGQVLPEEYQRAIAEFEKKKKNIAELMRIGNWRKAGSDLVNLKINQLARHEARDIMYDLFVYFQTNTQRLLEGLYIWTKSRSSGGWLVNLGGSLARDGANIFRWLPGDPSSNLRALLSRSS